MILSVIIVNYNVKFFLEQCLYSVERSLAGLGSADLSEIIVVDNNSNDGSLGYLSVRFPQVKWIANADNPGFARANNQALRQAQGEYILFLNPDTILAGDSCRICVNLLRTLPGVGAAGVRMVDGQGRFLPESRRGFPSAWVAFCRLSGLSSLLPRSKRFAGYYMGYLSEHINHPAPVLSGACCWCRRDILQSLGGFDERFFMYAEDIDLSYRIEQAGYTNYYIADTTIIHFKGESTLKDLRYTRLFYKAMSQFRKKYSRGGLPALADYLIEAAIWLRAGLAAIVNGWRLRQRRKDGRMEVNGMSGDPNGDPHTQNACWLTGDAATKRALLEKAPELPVVEAVKQAVEIVFCEGPDFSFRQCIESLEQASKDRRCKIHAAGSDSMAGSHSQIDLLVFKKI